MKALVVAPPPTIISTGVETDGPRRSGGWRKRICSVMTIPGALRAAREISFSVIVGLTAMKLQQVLPDIGVLALAKTSPQTRSEPVSPAFVGRDNDLAMRAMALSMSLTPMGSRNLVAASSPPDRIALADQPSPRIKLEREKDMAPPSSRPAAPRTPTNSSRVKLAGQKLPGPGTMATPVVAFPADSLGAGTMAAAGQPEILDPLRKGVDLALSAGAFALRSDARLIAGAGDVVASLAREGLR